MTTPVYIILVVVALLACILGSVFGYIFFRARHKEELEVQLEMDRALAEREANQKRPPLQLPPARSLDAQPSALEAERNRLREILAQRDLELSMLKQDYQIDTDLLRKEVEEANAEKEAALDRRETALAQKARELKEQKKALAAREAELNPATDALGDLKARLHSLKTRLAERTALLEEREAAVVELQARLEALEQEKAPPVQSAPQSPADTARLRADLLAREEEVDRLRMQLGEALEENIRLVQNNSPEPVLALSGESDGAQPYRNGSHGKRLPTFSPLSAYIDDTPGGVAPQAPPRRPARSTPSPTPAPGTPAPRPLRPQRDELTRITGITREIERQLNIMGYTSFDHLARWTSIDVRRVATQIGVHRQIVQGWIMTAQSFLFEGN